MPRLLNGQQRDVTHARPSQGELLHSDRVPGWTESHCPAAPGGSVHAGVLPGDVRSGLHPYPLGPAPSAGRGKWGVWSREEVPVGTGGGGAAHAELGMAVLLRAPEQRCRTMMFRVIRHWA